MRRPGKTYRAEEPSGSAQRNPPGGCRAPSKLLASGASSLAHSFFLSPSLPPGSLLCLFFIILTFTLNYNPKQFLKCFIFIYTFQVLNKIQSIRFKTKYGYTVKIKGSPTCYYSPSSSTKESLFMAYRIFSKRFYANTYTESI